ncbi:putative allophanate hydrolase subunit 2 [Desulforapulum autotrophicum HRM2]|uniref:Allophanate hydrolase subunit 2 n=1 Tax=Desulforapulum autotrophicum (strain ATCC 43914 / DSM 3382 / VKM B-1955 / HRM2) TaxID=177437 RepID=C0QGD2_DESAH|nr:biotin-dependent carboxyltransferase family protein [Desulforapulum autotrophicum]ACN17711.1 putative allophanate hydrolase subunit 2 [Desulforapulum autotrophicum HRM2]
MQTFRTIEPGGHTLVQDLGRFGFQRFGVPPCGALDPDAAKFANLLVNNQANDAVLEITFFGPVLEVLCSADIAVTGALMNPTLNGRKIENHRSHRVEKNDILAFDQATTGCRSYLAVTGGIDVPEIMGSRSCYTGAGIGGLDGRALKSGDILSRRDGALLERTRTIAPEFIPSQEHEITLRAVPGPQDHYFDQGLTLFFNAVFTVSPQANRMGYRLTGPVIRQKPSMPATIISEPSVAGGIQVPPDGQPIVLLGEQTVGGYTKIATVISTDLPKLAQALPGDTIRFTPVTLEQAHEAYKSRHRFFKALKAMDLSLDMAMDAKNHRPWGAQKWSTSDLARFTSLLERYMIQI